MDSTTDAVSNDRRGWILCVVSAIACVFGACIICVDVFVSLIPGKKDFRIEDSNAFLSGSLSLSFGVMIFSALFSMLPSSKRYLIADGVPPQKAGLLMMAAFVVGFVGIQVVSRIIHRFMPSHVVDCDHSHQDDGTEENGHANLAQSYHSHKSGHSHSHAHAHAHAHSRPRSHSHFSGPQQRRRSSIHAGLDGASDVTESTPLLASTGHTTTRPRSQRQTSSLSIASSSVARDEPAPLSSLPHGNGNAGLLATRQHGHALPSSRRPSMMEVRDRLLSFVKDTKANCDDFGPCYGYSDPCGQECKTHLAARIPALLRELPPPLRHTVASAAATATSPSLAATTSTISAANGGRYQMPWSLSSENITALPVSIDERGSGIVGNSTGPGPEAVRTTRQSHQLEMEVDGPTPNPGSATDEDGQSAANQQPPPHGHEHPGPYNDNEHYDVDLEAGGGGAAAAAAAAEDTNTPTAPTTIHGGAPHHHHVPANAFMSIGVQTVLAIGLHKFPEGFITFATNHANPALGFNVFLALLVHNIAEGFAMALPLYMALGSRLRAILWASALGGLSQPLGAGMAAVWLHYLGRGGDNGDNGGKGGRDDANGTAYGLLFAVTAGIMVAVALQLFVEGLTLHHNRQLCIIFGFVGMLLLGLSSSLVK